ncbi:MAG: serine hydroxymethyltransferase [Synergistaceae bacterium]|nr:serine hydroxymethyltransferase [Synergistaceae bacterium]
MTNVFSLIAAEHARQQSTIELIASENFVSENVLRAVGSCLTNKYAEGYPGARYYGGCENVDVIEVYCREKWREAFGTDYHVNVQPHSGSNANLAAFMAVLKPGDTILSMDLNHGGHLTHGAAVNISGKLFRVIHYGVTPDGLIDYDDLRGKILAYRPQLVLAGASAYSRIIDFQRIYADIMELALYNGLFPTPIFMADMAHIAGLVVSGDHPSPFGCADIITTTTHKTLRGPRGGMIFCKPEFAKRIDSAVFPGVQGGPLLHVIAGKAVAAEEACEPAFKNYIHAVVKNSQAMASEFQRMGYKVVTGGTDNHLFLLDLTETGLTGKQVQDELDRHGITLNKNCVPGETRSPRETSGVRIGTAAMTTKGFTRADFCLVAHKVDRVIRELRAHQA